MAHWKSQPPRPFCFEDQKKIQACRISSAEYFDGVLGDCTDRLQSHFGLSGSPPSPTARGCYAPLGASHPAPAFETHH